MRFLTVTLALLLLAGCSDQTQVRSYVTLVSTEARLVDSFGDKTKEVVQDLRDGPKPKNLKELADRFELVRDELAEQVKKLESSRKRVEAVPVPEEAKELERHLMTCYDNWLDLARRVTEVCDSAALACREVEQSPAKEKLRQMRASAKEVANQVNGLKKSVTDAGLSTAEMMKELNRLQKEFKILESS